MYNNCEQFQRKRKSDCENVFPCKKLLPEGNCAKQDGSSSNFVLEKLKPRSLVPMKDTPPVNMHEWLTQFKVRIQTYLNKNLTHNRTTQFQKWSNAERIVAINELIACCDPTQVRHMMQVIEPQFQRDFISLLPREVALSVLSFLEPRDLLRAAQTCRSWRFLADDNLLWKEKCRQAGFEDDPRKKVAIRNLQWKVMSGSGGR